MTTLTQGLIQLSEHPLVHSLGWTLLHFCWQGTAVALMLGCVLGLLGGRFSQARYGAACLALGLMVALPIGTFAHVASAEYKARATMLGSGVVLDAGIVLVVGADAPTLPWPVRIGLALDHSVPWVLLAWFAGVILFVGRLNFGLVVARRLKTAGTEAPSPALLQLFQRLRTRLGVQRAVALLHSTKVQVPTVIGWLRPVVLLPVSCLTGLSPEQIEAVLCHELAHVRRHDYLVSVVQSVIETVLFYHPAVWWVSKQVRRERECCCDELAVAVGGDVLAYARALSFLEENRAAFPEFVLGANGGVLKMRIKRILGSKRETEGSPVAALVALGMILAVAGSYFAAVSHAQAQAAREIATAALPVGSVSVSQGTATPGVQSTHPPPDSRVPIAQSQPVATPANVARNFIYLMPGIVGADGTVVVPTGISGTIVDPYGAPVPGAKVTTVNTDTGVKQSLDTGSSGLYGFSALPPGPYNVEVEAKGFQRLLQENIQVKAGQTVGLNLKLTVAAAAENLTAPITPTSIAKNSSQPDMSCTYYDDGIRAHPGTCEENSAIAGHYACRADDDTRPVQPQSSCEWKVKRLQDSQHSNQGSPVHLIPAGVMEGNLIYKVNPAYPEIAKAAHVQGVVVLHALISRTGDVEDLKVISGARMLTASAIDAVRQWKYTPYMFGGETFEVETTINVNFTLAASDSPGNVTTGAYPPAPPVGPSIRSIEYKGLNSVTIGEVGERFNREGIGLSLETPYDVARISQAAAALRQLLAERGHPNATITVATQSIPPGAIGIQFNVKEGPKGKASMPPAPPVADAAPSVQSALQEYNGAQVRKIGGGVSAPELTYKVDPTFTAESRKAKFNGIVLVNFIVDANGKPQNVHVLRGVGMGLDEKAVDAVKKYKFKPALEAGKPVPVELNVEVNFQVF